MCATLTRLGKTFILGQDQMQICPIERPHETSYVLAIAMFVIFVTVCQIISLITCQCTWFKNLTLEMRVKDNYFEENRQTYFVNVHKFGILDPPFVPLFLERMLLRGIQLTIINNVVLSTAQCVYCDEVREQSSMLLLLLLLVSVSICVCVCMSVGVCPCVTWSV